MGKVRLSHIVLTHDGHMDPDATYFRHAKPDDSRRRAGGHGPAHPRARIAVDHANLYAGGTVAGAC